MYKWKCPVCNSDNEGDFPDSNVCDTCGWEQDPVQEDDHDYPGGANRLSLNACKKEWALTRKAKDVKVVA